MSSPSTCSQPRSLGQQVSRTFKRLCGVDLEALPVVSMDPVLAGVTPLEGSASTEFFKNATLQYLLSHVCINFLAEPVGLVFTAASGLRARFRGLF